MNLNLPPPGSPEDVRQQRQILERLLHDIDRLWCRVAAAQQSNVGMPSPARDVTLEEEE